MNVLKFGGTSVADAAAVRKVIAIVQDEVKKGPMALVCSAQGGVTDMLLRTGNLAAAKDKAYRDVLLDLNLRHMTALRNLVPANEIDPVLEQVERLLRELSELLQGIFLLGHMPAMAQDSLVSYGERLSCSIIAAALRAAGTDAAFWDTTQLVLTDSKFGNARVDFAATNERLRTAWNSLPKGWVPVITGFVGANDKGQITTLGRGGSDYSAALVGAALHAEEIQIWTDVDGMLTADPRRVDQAYSIPAISYAEAKELSHFGAKVLYLPTLGPAMVAGIPIVIKNTFNPTAPGTRITRTVEAREDDNSIRGISSISDVALVRIEGSGMAGSSVLTAKILSAVAAAEIPIFFMTEASSQHSLCFAIRPSDVPAFSAVLERDLQSEWLFGEIQEPVIEYEKTLIAAVGENMRHKPGVAAKFFQALRNNGINVSAIAQGSSELNISVVIDRVNEAKALNAIHEEFFEEDKQSLNLFIAGFTGLVGGALMEQIAAQAAILNEQEDICINLIGLINTRGMLLNSNGISLNNYQEIFDAEAVKPNLSEFIHSAGQLNFANAVFVDCTAGKELVSFYKTLLANSISVVTPNKIANTLSHAEYRELRKTARRTGARFMYETNVGAGLPVISTLSALLNSGDRMQQIAAVLSGSLSFIFNNFKGETTFSEVVMRARELGYTEPDPRDDLSGLDVARKALILSRECGYPMELSDIQVQNLVPEPLRTVDVETFLRRLPEFDGEYEALKQRATEAGEVLRYMALIGQGKVEVTLSGVGGAHPFYTLSGSDNMIMFTTERYKTNPLVVRGPGAGAAVTAAGVFSEIIGLASGRRG